MPLPQYPTQCATNKILSLVVLILSCFSENRLPKIVHISENESLSVYKCVATAESKYFTLNRYNYTFICVMPATTVVV